MADNATPAAGTVPVLPVEVHLDYTFPEPFGIAEVTYIRPAGKKVLLASGIPIPNDELRAGMEVRLQNGVVATLRDIAFSYEPPEPPVQMTNGLWLSRVLGTIRHMGPAVMDVSWQGYTATNSPEHRYFSVTRHAWVPAEELRVGEFLRADNNLPTRVQGLSPPRFGSFELFNVEVEHLHNYFVGNGEGGSVLVHNGNNYIDQLADGSGASQERAARLKGLFKDVDPIEITGLDQRGKTPQEIARLLPKFTALQQEHGNPAFGILVDPKSARAWALRSGFSPDDVQAFNGISFKTGTMTQDVARAAGGAWGQRHNPLGAHLEGQAAAFMRKMDITDAVLYMNASTPCKGVYRDGCLFSLPGLLAENSTLSVFNKNGRLFPFTGTAD